MPDSYHHCGHQCLPGALIAKDPSRNWLTVRKKHHNSLNVDLIPTSLWNLLGFVSFLEKICNILFKFAFELYPMIW